MMDWDSGQNDKWPLFCMFLLFRSFVIRKWNIGGYVYMGFGMSYRDWNVQSSTFPNGDQRPGYLSVDCNMGMSQYYHLPSAQFTFFELSISIIAHVDERHLGGA